MEFKITDGLPGQNGEFKSQLFSEPLIPGKATKFVLVLFRKEPKGKRVPIDTGMAFVTDPAFALVSRFLDPAHDIEIEVQLSSGKMDALLN